MNLDNLSRKNFFHALRGTYKTHYVSNQELRNCYWKIGENFERQMFSFIYSLGTQVRIRKDLNILCCFTEADWNLEEGYCLEDVRTNVNAVLEFYSRVVLGPIYGGPRKRRVLDIKFYTRKVQDGMIIFQGDNDFFGYKM